MARSLSWEVVTPGSAIEVPGIIQLVCMMLQGGTG